MSIQPETTYLDSSNESLTTHLKQSSNDFHTSPEISFSKKESSKAYETKVYETETPLKVLIFDIIASLIAFILIGSVCSIINIGPFIIGYLIISWLLYVFVNLMTIGFRLT